MFPFPERFHHPVFFVTTFNFSVFKAPFFFYKVAPNSGMEFFRHGRQAVSLSCYPGSMWVDVRGSNRQNIRL